VEGSEQAASLNWVTGLLFALALLIPLAFALYHFAKKGKDKHVVWMSLLTAALVAGVWIVVSRQEARRAVEVETVKKELEALQTAPVERNFSTETHDLMIERLKGVHGPSVFVLANSSDAETTQFSREIVAVFKESGWEVPESFGMIFTPVMLPGEQDVPSGVVLGATPEVPQRILDAVYAAFQDAGIEISRGPHWPGTEHPISILVGPN
jgi:hypothetical protein